MTDAARQPDITSIAPWFGNNRTSARRVADLFGPLAHCTVPFLGGAPELLHIKTRDGVASDLHRHLINLVRVTRDDELRERMIADLDSRIFHASELAEAQARCTDRERNNGQRADLFGVITPAPDLDPDPLWAADYFVCSWMGRGGAMGKVGEFDQSLAVRMTSSGGSSAKRWRSAVESLRPWGRAFASWSFVVRDGLSLLDDVTDNANHGIYLDPPWPDAGDDYRHSMPVKMHDDIARRLCRFNHTKIVVRYADHPAIRECYANEDRWRWHRFPSKNQAGNEYPEVLIESVRA